MAKTPSNLIYSVDENPSLLVMLILGLQHAFVMTSTLVLPVVIVLEIRGTLEQAHKAW